MLNDNQNKTNALVRTVQNNKSLNNTKTKENLPKFNKSEESKNKQLDKFVAEDNIPRTYEEKRGFPNQRINKTSNKGSFIPDYKGRVRFKNRNSIMDTGGLIIIFSFWYICFGGFEFKGYTPFILIIVGLYCVFGIKAYTIVDYSLKKIYKEKSISFSDLIEVGVSYIKKYEDINYDGNIRKELVVNSQILFLLTNNKIYKFDVFLSFDASKKVRDVDKENLATNLANSLNIDYVDNPKQSELTIDKKNITNKQFLFYNPSEKELERRYNLIKTAHIIRYAFLAIVTMIVGIVVYRYYLQ